MAVGHATNTNLLMTSITAGAELSCISVSGAASTSLKVSHGCPSPQPSL